jgi:hypothetical protein
VDPKVILAKSLAVEQGVKSLKGDGRLTVHSPTAKGTTTVFVAVERPAKVHVEVLDFFGRPTVLWVSDGAVFGLFQGDQGVYCHGPASPENLSRFLPIRLPEGQLVQLLLGEPPRDGDARATASYDEGQNAYVLSLEGALGPQALTVEPGTFRIRRSVVQGGYPYQADFGDFGGGPFHFPKRMRLDAKRDNTQLELRYTGVELNPSLPAALFVPQAPPAARVVEVDAEGRPLH